MRTILGLIAGVLVAAVVMLVISQIGALLFPVAGLEAHTRDAEQFSAAFSAAPLGSKLALILSWLGGTWAGGVVARLVSRRDWTAWGVAAMMLLLALPIVSVITLPVWLQLALVLAPMLGGLLAKHIPDRTRRATPEEGSHAQV